MSKNISICEAVVLWNSAGQVKVTSHPCSPHEQDGYHASDGACCAGWDAHAPEELVIRLVCIAWKLALVYGIPAPAIHAEFQKIAEYRAFYATGFCPDKMESIHDCI